MPDKHGRRRARAEAIDYFDEPASFLGGLGQAATRNPVDAFGLLVAGGLAGMIAVNALFLQDGRPSTPSALTVPIPQAHPAPAPAPRQADAVGSLLSGRQQNAQAPAQPAAVQPRPASSTSSTAASVATPTALPTKRPGTPAVAEPAPGASGEADQGSSPRILAVQRVLAERGFGPLKADGYFGEETRAAIRRFERIVGLPQKGELTPEVLTALSKVSGKKLR